MFFCLSACLSFILYDCVSACRATSVCVCVCVPVCQSISNCVCDCVHVCQCMYVTNETNPISVYVSFFLGSGGGSVGRAVVSTPRSAVRIPTPANFFLPNVSK